MKIKNRFISGLLATIMLLSSFASLAFPVTALAETNVQPIGNVTVSTKMAGKPLLIFSAAPSAPDFTFNYITYTKNGKEWPAYCVQPNKPGVENVGSYQVNASTLMENPQVYGAIINGWPFKTPTELGVKDSYEAYYITKLAIWSIVHPNYSDPNKFEPNGPENAHVYQAYKNLLAKAKATTNITNTSLLAEWQSETTEGDNQVHTYKVKTSTGDYIGNYEVSMTGEVPTGTRIEKSGSTFKVIIPLNSIRDNTSGSFELSVKSASGNGNALVYNGIPSVSPDI